MSVLNTQSVLSQRLDEKEQKQNAMIELAPNFVPQSTPPQNPVQNAELMSAQMDDGGANTASQSQNAPTNATTPFSSDEFNAYKETFKNSQRQITNSDDYTPEQIEFVLAFSKESDELLKKGASKKKMVDFLREQDILDAQTWDILNKESGGDDELLFDFLKQNADSVRNRIQNTDDGLLNALENEKFLLDKAAPTMNESERNARFARQKELEKEIFDLKNPHFKGLKDISEFEKDFEDKGFFNTLKKTAKETYKSLAPELFHTEKMREYDESMKHNISLFAKNGVKFDELKPIYKDYLLDNDIAFGADKFKNAKTLYQSYIDYENAMKKDKWDELNENEKKAFKDRLGIMSNLAFKWDSFFKNENEAFKDTKEYQNALENLTPEYLQRIEYLRNIDESHKLINFLNPDETQKALRDKYEQNLLKVLEPLGVEALLYNQNENGEVEQFAEFADGRVVRLENGFLREFSNALKASQNEIVASITGALYGAKKGKTPRARAMNSILYAAYGAVGGAGLDLAVTNMLLDKDTTASEVINHLTQAGVMSVVGDGAAIALGKVAGKPLRKVGAEIAKPVKWLGEKALNLSVVGRFGKNALDGNAPEIRRAIRESMSEEQIAALRESNEKLGLEIEFAPQGTDARDFFVKHFGEDSFLTKGYDLFMQAFYLGGQKDLQKELLATMRSDSEQNLMGYLIETAMQSPKRRANLHKMLNATSAELIEELKSFGLKENEIENVLNRYKKGVEFDFGEAIDKVLSSIYGDEKTYKTIVSREAWDKFKAQMLENHASFGKEVIEPLIEQLEKTIYNPQGVGYKALRDAQEFLNAEFPKLAKQSGKKKYLKSQIQGFIRDDLEKGFNQIFDLNSVLAKDAKELFDTALLDYANMKQIIKEMGTGLIEEKTAAGIRKGKKDYENALNKLMDFLTRETPENATPFLKQITSTMPKEEAERFEIALLDNILKNSRYLIESGDKKVLDIVNSGEFLRRVSEIKGQFGKKGQEYIDLVAAWHKHFKNDAIIAHLTRGTASEPKISTGLNPSLDARIKYVATATMFDGLFRLLPRIPIITDKFIGNDKIQTAALRYYLKKTLDRTPSISSLRRKLNFDLNKGDLPLNSATRKKLREITDIVETSEAELEKNTDELLKKSENETSLGRGTPHPNSNDNIAKKNLNEAKNNPRYSAEQKMLDEINTQKAVLAAQQKRLENLNKLAEMRYLDPYAFRVEKTQLELDIAQRQQKINELENEIFKKKDLPIKSTLEKPLQPAEIKQSIDKWDLSNPNPNDKILISKVQGDELEQLKKEFDFKGNYALAREIEAKNVKHALMQHGDEAKEATRGQIAITKDDIANYQQFTQKPDLRIVQDNNRIIYAKQINGHYVVIEEVLTGQNKLQFFDMWKGKGEINKEVLLSHSQRPKHDFEPNFNRHMPSNTDEIIPNSSVQSQAAPQATAQEVQKSLLDLAREETERLRQAQIDKELAQKEAEIARLKEMKAQQEQIIAQKESKAGLSANEAQRLEIGESIPTKLIKPTKIIINDSTQPFEAEFVIAKKSDIKPNFERTGTQGRSEKQSKVIDNIQSDFKPHLIFEQSGGFEGLPIITKDGQVIAGNHRAEAINALSGEQLAKYKQAAKEKFSVDLADDEVIVRLVKDGDEKELINLTFMSNVGRESNLGEKALSNLAKFEKEMPNLPNHINAQSVDELQNIISKTLDKQGAGLNTFDTNLALFSKLAKSTPNNDILETLNALNTLSPQDKAKVLKMYVDNAGAFYNIAKDSELKSLNLSDYLNDAVLTTAKSVDESARKADFVNLLDTMNAMINSADEMIKIDKNLFENFKARTLGLALARFARLENPSSQLFEFLKNAKSNLEYIHTGNVLGDNKALSEIDIYDFLSYAVNSGRALDENLLGKITSKLDEIRAVEKKALKNADESANVAKNAEKISAETNLNKQSYETINDKERFLKEYDFAKNAVSLPKELNVDEFLQSLKSVKNKENFIAHLQSKDDAQARLAFLNLIEPTLKEPDIILTNGQRTTKIKPFKDENGKNVFEILITEDGDKILVTSIPTSKTSYIKSKVKNADLIQIFASRDSKDTMSNGLSNDIIPNTAPKSQGEQKIADLAKQKADDNLKNALDLFNGDEKALNDYIKELEADKINLSGDELTLKTDNGAEIKFIVDNHKTLRLADENDFLRTTQSEYSHKQYSDNFDKADEWLLKNDSDFRQKRQEMLALHKELETLSTQIINKYQYDIEKYGLDDILRRNKKDPIITQYKKITKKYDELHEQIIEKRDELIDQYEKEALSGGENAVQGTPKIAQTPQNTTPKSQVATPLQESTKNQQILDEYLAQNEKLAQDMKELVGKDSISVDDFIDILNGSNAELKFTKEDLLDYDKLVQTAPYTTPALANILGLYKKELEKGIDLVRENLRQMFEKGTLKENDKGRYLVTDKDGKKHILNKDLAHKWLQTFNLKSFDDDFVPQIKDEFKPFLQNGEIHLKIGSLVKIAERNRADFIKHIKPTLQEPNAILRQNDGALIFVKDFGDKKFFASVAKNENGEWVITSNAPKTLSNLKNKIKMGGELLYSDLPELPIIAQPELTAKALNGEAKSKEIIPNSSVKSQMSYDDYLKAKKELEAQTKLKLKSLKDEMEQSLPEKALKKELQAIRDELKTLDDETGWSYANFFIKNPKKTQAFSFSSEEKAKSSLEWANRFLDDYTKADDKKGIDYISRLRDIVKKHIDNIDNANALHTELKNNNVMKEKMIEQDYDKCLQALQEQLANTTQITNDKARANATALKRFAKMFNTNIDKEIIEKNFKDELTPHIYERELQTIHNLRQEIENATNTTPLKEFGTNYAEFYKDGAGAVKKLLAEAKAASEAGESFNGQVAGAFWRKELGDIDLVFGDESMGLAHIVKKHGDEFTQFKGDTQSDKIANALSEIVKNGVVESKNGVNSIVLKQHGQEFRVGLSKGFDGKGENKWIITAYKNKGGGETSYHDTFTSKEPLQNLDNANFTTKEIQSQGNKNAPQNSLFDDINATPKAEKTEIDIQKTSLKDEKDFENFFDENKTFDDFLSKQSDEVKAKWQGSKPQYFENLNESLKKATFIFKTSNKDEYNNALFDKVIQKANDLGVRYWSQSNPKWIGGSFTFWLNRAMIDNKLFKTNMQEATKTLLHELIHSTTSRAIHAFDNGLAHLLSEAQIQGIKELKSLFNEVRNKHRDKAYQIFGDRKTSAEQNAGKIYGLANEHEMLAELSNKSFRDFLKGENIFVKIIDAILKIFGYEKKDGFNATSNAFKEAENALYKIMDNYKDTKAFTRDFDDIYKNIDFVDFDNYKKYLTKHTQRVKDFVNNRSMYEYKLIHGGHGQGYTHYGEAVFQKALGVKSLDELESTPITNAVREVIEGEEIFHLNKRIAQKDATRMRQNLAIITAFAPLIRKGIYKKIDDEAAEFLVENVKNIGSKELNYRKYFINDFFAVDFVEKFLEKYNKANLSLKDLKNSDIMPSLNLSKGKKMNLSEFLNDKGEVDYTKLEKLAVDLPSSLNYKKFLAQFENNDKVIIKTPIKDLQINPRYMFFHLTKDGDKKGKFKGNGKENRIYLSGGVLETLQKPLFVTQGADETYYFYKAFKNDKGLINLVSIAVPKNNSQMIYRTSYNGSDNRIAEIIKEHKLIYKAD